MTKQEIDSEIEFCLGLTEEELMARIVEKTLSAHLEALEAREAIDQQHITHALTHPPHE